MGTTASQNPAESKFKNFYEMIDYVATYYILTMDFKSLTKLNEKEYCNKLILLSANIIKQNFNNFEITHINKRVQFGTEYMNEMITNKLSFIPADKLQEYYKLNADKKRFMCIAISKFYVKIAHIFSAIMKTVNPIYAYVDEHGVKHTVGLENKKDIPKSATFTGVDKINMCDNRIQTLSNNININDITQQVSFHQNICSIYGDQSAISLTDEIGIPEFYHLYLDSGYDTETGKFTKMSDHNKAMFDRDLQVFYSTFTGNATMPETIKSFKDITLKDFQTVKICDKIKSISRDDPVFKDTTTLTNTLFIQYADNIKQMMDKAIENQKKLLEIMNELFVLTDGTKSQNMFIDIGTFAPPESPQDIEIRIHPELTEQSLQTLVEKTRKLLLKLYIECEEDYIQGIKIYEAIIENKILETNRQQLLELEKQKHDIINLANG